MTAPGGRPTALLSAQNFITLGAVQALHDLALQHEIAIVGFDDVDLAAAVDPALTVMPQQPTELGRMAGGCSSNGWAATLVRRGAASSRANSSRVARARSVRGREASTGTSVSGRRVVWGRSACQVPSAS